MSPVTHLLISWTTANTCDLTKRDRMLVVIAGILPDMDGLGMVVDIFTKNSNYYQNLWGSYHHVLGHNLGIGLSISLVAFCLASRRWVTACISLFVFHIHLICDLIGARGPEGFQWPIPYLLPFSNSLQLTWKGQWALNAWPNFLVTGFCLMMVFYLAWKKGFSPLEMISIRMDQVFIHTLRKRFGDPVNKIQ